MGIISNFAVRIVTGPSLPDADVFVDGLALDRGEKPNIEAPTGTRAPGPIPGGQPRQSV